MEFPRETCLNVNTPFLPSPFFSFPSSSSSISFSSLFFSSLSTRIYNIKDKIGAAITSTFTESFINFYFYICFISFFKISSQLYILDLKINSIFLPIHKNNGSVFINYILFHCIFIVIESNSTPPIFSNLETDFSTGYLQDALFEFSSKRRRLDFCKDDEIFKDLAHDSVRIILEYLYEKN